MPALTRLLLLAATTGDVPFLWLMLTYAASMSPPGPDAIAEAREDPYLRSYVEKWGRRGDFGLVAWRDGARVGAAWHRLRGPDEHAMKLAGADVPEVTIAVPPGGRGAGVGAALLGALIERARGRFPALVLSVRRDNPARRLYERAGFTVTREISNRVGGVSLEMRLTL